MYNTVPTIFSVVPLTIDNPQATATKGNKKVAVSATNFVKVVRALLRGSPRSATAASASAVAIPVPASEADEEENNCKEAATHHQIRTTTSRESRAALDISGHRFANNLQVINYGRGGSAAKRKAAKLRTNSQPSDELLQVIVLLRSSCILFRLPHLHTYLP